MALRMMKNVVIHCHLFPFYFSMVVVEYFIDHMVTRECI